MSSASTRTTTTRSAARRTPSGTRSCSAFARSTRRTTWSSRIRPGRRGQLHRGDHRRNIGGRRPRFSDGRRRRARAHQLRRERQRAVVLVREQQLLLLPEHRGGHAGARLGDLLRRGPGVRAPLRSRSLVRVLRRRQRVQRPDDLPHGLRWSEVLPQQGAKCGEFSGPRECFCGGLQNTHQKILGVFAREAGRRFRRRRCRSRRRRTTAPRKTARW